MGLARGDIPMKRLRLMVFGDKQFDELLRDSIVLLVVRVLAVMLGLATLMIVARWFGAGATGLVALFNSVALVFGTFAAFGLGELLMRELSSADAVTMPHKRHIFFKALVAVLSVAGFLLALPLVLIYLRLPEFALHSPVLVLGVAIMLLLGRALLNFMEKISRAVSGVRVYASFLILPVLINFIIVSVCGLYGVRMPLLPSIALAFAVGVSAVFLLIYLSHRLAMQDQSGIERPAQSYPENKLPDRKMLLRKGFPFAVSAVLAMLIMEGNLIVAGFLLPIDQVGVYSVAHKMSLLTAFFLTSVNMIAAPRFSRLHASGETEQLRNYSQRVTALIFLATIPIILVFIFARDWLILTGFGPEFRDAAPALAILMIGQAVNAYTGVSNIFLNMTMGEKQLAQVIAVAATINIVLSLLLTPHFGINGLAIALAVSLSVWNLAAIVVIRVRNGFWLCWIPVRFLNYGR